VSYRPLDWAPLAETDPLPGDPQAIWEEAARLRDMAAEVQDQIAALRGIGEVDLVGEYVEELFASAEDVAKKLDLVRDRYVKVAGYLNQWAGELDDLQRRTLAALHNALDAERLLQRDAHADLPGVIPSGYLGAHLIEPAEAPALAVLAKARRDLQRVLDEATARDRHWGSTIGDAIDDKLTDHWRDHLHHWVERNHRWLKDLSTGLGWATTIAAVGAMAFPPAGVAVLALSAANLAIHGTEALGGEKGALFEAGLDIVGIASFGSGKLISRGLGRTFEATQEAAAAAASGETAAGVREAASTSAEWETAVRNAESGSMEEQQAARDYFRDVERSAEAVGNAESRAVFDTESANVGFLKALAAGSKDDAHLINDTKLLVATYGDDAAVQAAALPLSVWETAGQANWIPATALDLGDKTARFMPYGGAYKRYEDQYVLSGGDFYE
jgi:hypothetical protein